MKRKKEFIQFKICDVENYGNVKRFFFFLCRNHTDLLWLTLSLNNMKKKDEKFMVSNCNWKSSMSNWIFSQRAGWKEQGLLLDVKHALENSIKKFFFVRETLSWEFLAGKNFSTRFNLVKWNIIYAYM